MTIQECLDYLMPGSWASPPAWLPDAFGVSAYLLQQSGGYTTVVAGWPPSSPAGTKWTEGVRDVGLRWRALSVTANHVPPEVQVWWDTVIAAGATPLRDLPNPANKSLCEALLQLMAAADEGSTGIGMPGK